MQIYEAFPSREFRSGSAENSSGDQIVLRWIVLGVTNELVVKALVSAYSGPVCDNLFQQIVSAKQIAPDTWEAEVQYGVLKRPEANEYKFTFDTTGGRQKITQSLETVHKYAPSGKTPADHKGAIGVTDHGVEGCEIVVPKYAWTETWQLPIDIYNWSYSQVLKSVTGRVNSGTFRGFPAGQVLFHGGKGSGSNKDPTLIEITYSFEQSDDVQSQAIGDISGVQKAGWQYLWVHYVEQHDSNADAIARRPDAVYVERVYDAADFGALGIGG